MRGWRRFGRCWTSEGKRPALPNSQGSKFGKIFDVVSLHRLKRVRPAAAAPAIAYSGPVSLTTLSHAQEAPPSTRLIMTHH